MLKNRLWLPCLGAALVTACGETPPTLCQEQTRRCLNIETGDVAIGGREYFNVRLANSCREDVEYKLCFEVPDAETADCRQDVLEALKRAEESIPLSRFGGRSRVFVRYLREAKACRFPLTRDVDF